MKQTQVNLTFLAAAGCMLCAISAAAGAITWPKVATIVGVRKQLIEQVREFEAAKEAACFVQAYQEHQKDIVTALLEQYDAKMPVGESVPTLLADVKMACAAAGVGDVAIVTREPEALNPDAQQQDGQSSLELYCLPLVLTGRGDYRSLAAMLTNLAAGRRLVLVRELSAEKPENAGQAIVFRAEADAFCFLKPKEQSQ